MDITHKEKTITKQMAGNANDPFYPEVVENCTALQANWAQCLNNNFIINELIVPTE